MKKALFWGLLAPLSCAAVAQAGQLIFRETETSIYVELTGELDKIPLPGRRPPEKPAPAEQEVVAMVKPRFQEYSRAAAAPPTEEAYPDDAAKQREARLKARSEERAKARKRRVAEEVD